MINITLGVVLGSPSMKYPKNGFKIINISQILKMNPARGFCFIVQCNVCIKCIMWFSTEQYLSAALQTFYISYKQLDIGG